MNKPAILSPAAGAAPVASSVSTSESPAPPQASLPVVVAADAADAADGQVPNQLKQIKTKVTERVKKTEGKPDTIIWDVRVGVALFNVYRTPIGDRELFTLSYRLDGKRYRQVVPTLAAAIDAAKAKGKQLSRGDIVAVDMSPADRASAAKVLGWLKPLGLSLELVVSEWLDARKRLGPVSLSRAVDSHLKRYPQNMPSKMVKEVVEEMIGIKRADKLSDRYIKQLEYNMNRFMGRFKNRLLDVGGTDVDAWLRELKVGPRTRNNLRNSVQALFNYAIARKYLPKDHDDIDAVPLAKDRGGEIEIYTPAEMKELLAVASDEHVPFLAISAFAGVRHAEVKRLDWANVNRKAKIIEIKAGTAKTASRRVIPIQPNLAVRGYLGTVAVVQRKSLADAVTEFCDGRKAKTMALPGKRPALNPVYVADTTRRLNEFAESFTGTSVADLAKTHINAFVGAHPALSPKSRNHLRATLRMFLGWCVRHDYLPANHRLLETDGLQKELLDTASIDFYRPNELRALLNSFWPETSVLKTVWCLEGSGEAESG